MAATKFYHNAASYAEKHDLFAMFEGLLQEVIIRQPDDPLSFLIEELQKPPTLKVIIAGPPASGKGTQCEKIVEKYGLCHISTGDCLREEKAKGSDLGKMAAEYMDSGALVPDDVIIGIVKNKLDSDECRTKGWLLDGFPRTHEQALALQEAGIIPDKFVLLETPDEVLVERVTGRRLDPTTGKIYHLTFKPPENEEIAKALIQRSDDTEEKLRPRLKAYHRNVESILDCYKSICKRIQADMPSDKVFEELDYYLSSRPRTLAPHTPDRMAIIGGPGTGKTTNAKKISWKYNVSYVSIEEILRLQVQRGTEEGLEIKACQRAGEPVPDDLQVSLVKDTLKNLGSQGKGWILDDFPRNQKQAGMLSDAGLAPKTVVCLEMEDRDIVSRLGGRMYDPVTGAVYHVDGKMPDEAHIEARLCGRPGDEEENVLKRIDAFRQNAQFADTFKQVVRVDGNKSEENVFELISHFLDNPKVV